MEIVLFICAGKFLTLKLVTQKNHPTQFCSIRLNLSCLCEKHWQDSNLKIQSSLPLPSHILERSHEVPAYVRERVNPFNYTTNSFSNLFLSGGMRCVCVCVSKYF